MHPRLPRLASVLLCSALATLALPAGSPFLSRAEAKGASAHKKLLRMAGALSRVKGFVAADDKRLEALGAAAQATAAQNDKSAAKALLALLNLRCQSASVEVAIAEAGREGLIATTSSEAHAVARKALEKGKKRFAVVVTLSEIVGSWEEPESAKVLGTLLKSKDERIVLAAARGLGKLKLRESVGVLVEAFGAWYKRGGEVVEVLGSALFDLTGRGAKSPGAWEKWWKTTGKTFDPKKRKDRGVGGTRPRNYQKKKPPQLFESLEVKSRRVVIVMDVSGSMHMRQFVEEPGEAGEPLSTSKGKTTLGGAPALPAGDPRKPGYTPKKCTFHQCPGARGKGTCPSDENLPVYYQRLKRLSRQVEKVVRALPKKVRFNMVAFSTDARSWKGGKLIPASAGNKTKAIGWLRGLNPSGVTNSDKALRLAFKFSEADTVIFVTDGAPTTPAGKVLEDKGVALLLSEVKRLNKSRKLRIDVIAIAQGAGDFTSALAEQNRGKYVTVD